MTRWLSSFGLQHVYNHLWPTATTQVLLMGQAVKRQVVLHDLMFDINSLRAQRLAENTVGDNVA